MRGPWSDEEGGVDPKRRRAAYAQTFCTPHGEKVLQDIRERFSGAPSFVASNQYATAYNEGMRAVVLYIDECMKE